MPFTTIRIEDEVRDRLRNKGKMGESYNEVIKRLLDLADTVEAERKNPIDFNRPIRPSSFG